MESRVNAGDFLNATCRLNGMFLLPMAHVSEEVMNAFYDNLPPEIEEITKRLGWSEEEVDELRDESRDAWDMLFEGMGMLGVRNTNGITEIAPGTQVAITFAFRVPKGLDQHTRYVGVYPLYDADISFVIVPGPGQANGQEDDNAARS